MHALPVRSIWMALGVQVQQVKEHALDFCLLKEALLGKPNKNSIKWLRSLHIALNGLFEFCVFEMRVPFVLLMVA